MAPSCNNGRLGAGIANIRHMQATVSMAGGFITAICYLRGNTCADGAVRRFSMVSFSVLSWWCGDQWTMIPRTMRWGTAHARGCHCLHSPYLYPSIACWRHAHLSCTTGARHTTPPLSHTHSCRPLRLLSQRCCLRLPFTAPLFLPSYSI